MDDFAIGNKKIVSFFKGSIGIKRIYMGEKNVYDRPGGYFFLELDTKGEINNG